ncbi:hypothetical protein ACFYXM_01325 [Streptomyces sp. NPDC002476]|uniref:hypothetical protein n=1 Tax=Streptomyces sp. NPDC002476 TaxID=3364648 RepID=UPI0036A3F1F2
MGDDHHDHVASVPHAVDHPDRGAALTLAQALAGAAPGNVCPVATSGTHSRCTSRKPKYVQYKDFRPAHREHAPHAAP